MWKQWHCLNILSYWINTALKLTCMLPNAIIHTMKSLLHGPRMPFRSTVMQGHVANILHLICTILTILVQYFLETCSLDLMPTLSIYRTRRLLSPIGHKPERPALFHSAPISSVRQHWFCCHCCWTYLLQEVQKNIPTGSRIWILTFYHMKTSSGYFLGWWPRAECCPLFLLYRHNPQQHIFCSVLTGSPLLMTAMGTRISVISHDGLSPMWPDPILQKFL